MEDNSFPESAKQLSFLEPTKMSVWGQPTEATLLKEIELELKKNKYPEGSWP